MDGQKDKDSPKGSIPPPVPPRPPPMRMETLEVLERVENMEEEESYFDNSTPEYNTMMIDRTRIGGAEVGPVDGISHLGPFPSDMPTVGMTGQTIFSDKSTKRPTQNPFTSQEAIATKPKLIRSVSPSPAALISHTERTTVEQHLEPSHVERVQKEFGMSVSDQAARYSVKSLDAPTTPSGQRLQSAAPISSVSEAVMSPFILDPADQIAYGAQSVTSPTSPTPISPTPTSPTPTIQQADVSSRSANTITTTYTEVVTTVDQHGKVVDVETRTQTRTEDVRPEETELAVHTEKVAVEGYEMPAEIFSVVEESEMEVEETILVEDEPTESMREDASRIGQESLAEPHVEGRIPPQGTLIPLVSPIPGVDHQAETWATSLMTERDNHQSLLADSDLSQATSARDDPSYGTYAREHRDDTPQNPALDFTREDFAQIVSNLGPQEEPAQQSYNDGTADAKDRTEGDGSRLTSQCPADPERSYGSFAREHQDDTPRNPSLDFTREDFVRVSPGGGEEVDDIPPAMLALHQEVLETQDDLEEEQLEEKVQEAAEHSMQLYNAQHALADTTGNTAEDVEEAIGVQNAIWEQGQSNIGTQAHSRSSGSKDIRQQTVVSKVVEETVETIEVIEEIVHEVVSEARKEVAAEKQYRNDGASFGSNRGPQIHSINQSQSTETLATLAEDPSSALGAKEKEAKQLIQDSNVNEVQQDSIRVYPEELGEQVQSIRVFPHDETFPTAEVPSQAVHSQVEVSAVQTESRIFPVGDQEESAARKYVRLPTETATSTTVATTVDRDKNTSEVLPSQDIQVTDASVASRQGAGASSEPAELKPNESIRVFANSPPGASLPLSSDGQRSRADIIRAADPTRGTSHAATNGNHFEQVATSVQTAVVDQGDQFVHEGNYGIDQRISDVAKDIDFDQKSQMITEQTVVRNVQHTSTWGSPQRPDTQRDVTSSREPNVTVYEPSTSGDSHIASVGDAVESRVCSEERKDVITTQVTTTTKQAANSGDRSVVEEVVESRTEYTEHAMSPQIQTLIAEVHPDQRVSMMPLDPHMRGSRDDSMAVYSGTGLAESDSMSRAHVRSASGRSDSARSSRSRTNSTDRWAPSRGQSEDNLQQQLFGEKPIVTTVYTPDDTPMEDSIEEQVKDMMSTSIIQSTSQAFNIQSPLANESSVVQEVFRDTAQNVAITERESSEVVTTTTTVRTTHQEEAAQPLDTMDLSNAHIDDMSVPITTQFERTPAQEAFAPGDVADPRISTVQPIAPEQRIVANTLLMPPGSTAVVSTETATKFDEQAVREDIILSRPERFIDPAIQVNNADAEVAMVTGGRPAEVIHTTETVTTVTTTAQSWTDHSGDQTGVRSDQGTVHVTSRSEESPAERDEPTIILEDVTSTTDADLSLPMDPSQGGPRMTAVEIDAQKRDGFPMDSAQPVSAPQGPTVVEPRAHVAKLMDLARINMASPESGSFTSMEKERFTALRDPDLVERNSLENRRRSQEGERYLSLVMRKAKERLSADWERARTTTPSQKDRLRVDDTSDARMSVSSEPGENVLGILKNAREQQRRASERMAFEETDFNPEIGFVQKSQNTFTDTGRHERVKFDVPEVTDTSRSDSHHVSTITTTVLQATHAVDGASVTDETTQRASTVIEDLGGRDTQVGGQDATNVEYSGFNLPSETLNSVTDSNKVTARASIGNYSAVQQKTFAEDFGHLRQENQIQSVTETLRDDVQIVDYVKVEESSKERTVTTTTGQAVVTDHFEESPQVLNRVTKDLKEIIHETILQDVQGANKITSPRTQTLPSSTEQATIVIDSTEWHSEHAIDPGSGAQQMSSTQSKSITVTKSTSDVTAEAANTPTNTATQARDSAPKSSQIVENLPGVEPTVPIQPTDVTILSHLGQEVEVPSKAAIIGAKINRGSIRGPRHLDDSFSPTKEKKQSPLPGDTPAFAEERVQRTDSGSLLPTTMPDLGVGGRNTVVGDVDHGVKHLLDTRTGQKYSLKAQVDDSSLVRRSIAEVPVQEGQTTTIVESRTVTTADGKTTTTVETTETKEYTSAAVVASDENEVGASSIGERHGGGDSNRVRSSSEEDLYDDGRAWGKTPDGALFVVPETKAMIGSVFGMINVRSVFTTLSESLKFPSVTTRPSSSHQEKALGVNIFDLVTILVMGIQIILYLTDLLPREVFLGLFIFWRIAYNVVIGMALKSQSDSRFLTRKLQSIFAKDVRWQWWFKRQYELKMGRDFVWEDAPSDFHSWLVFRNMVDLVLINDFATYLIMAVAYWEDLYTMTGWVTELRTDMAKFDPLPHAKDLLSAIVNLHPWIRVMTESYDWTVSLSLMMATAQVWTTTFLTKFWNLVLVRLVDAITLGDICRYTLAGILAAFNVWVKMDAHRVVKDFAWYWGDFFFLLANPSLTFDGVFEMAPHPMYSVGYTWKYGISLITRSYTVLLASIFAHVMQMLFLVIVENPHIKKIYGDSEEARGLEEHVRSDAVLRKRYRAYFQPRKELKLFFHFDPFRGTDFMIAVAVVYASAIGIWSGPKVALAQYVAWQVIHTMGLGMLLKVQSTQKFWTRHFKRRGHSAQDAFNSWKALMNLSMCLIYVTFAVCAYHHYEPVPLLSLSGPALLRHIVGIALILFQVWQAWSSYEVIGDFGWFYGDFFIEEFPHRIYYTGIYRYMNNPERYFGHLAFWGMVIIVWSSELALFTLAAHIAQLIFLQFVEAPHMRKMYGDQVRKESGIEHVVKSRMIAPIMEEVEMRRNKVSNMYKDSQLYKMSNLAKDTKLFQDADRLYRKYKSADKEEWIARFRVLEMKRRRVAESARRFLRAPAVPKIKPE